MKALAMPRRSIVRNEIIAIKAFESTLILKNPSCIVPGRILRYFQ